MTDEGRAERLLVQIESIDRGASEQSLDDGTAWRLQVEHVVEFIRTIRAEAREKQRDLHRRTQDAESNARAKVIGEIFGPRKIDDTVRGMAVRLAEERDAAIARADVADASLAFERVTVAELRAEAHQLRVNLYLAREERDAEKARAERAEAERDAVPCAECGAPATCFGVCDGVPGHACDECCGHGDEEGWCKPIADASTYLLSQRDAAIAARAESEAALSLLREQWDAMEVERRDAVQAWKEANGYDDLIDAYGAVVEERNELRAEVERLTKVRAAAERVVEVYETRNSILNGYKAVDAAIDALRAALAQPERKHYAEIE